MEFRLSPRILYSLATAAFLLVAASGGWGSMGMHNGEGSMGACLLMPGESSLCTMSVWKHVSTLQNKLAALPQRASILALLALAVWAISITFRWLPSFQSGREGTGSVAWLRYLHEHLDTTLRDPLQHAFARGILHPKIF